MNDEIHFPEMTFFERSADIIHADMDGETVMMSIELGEYFGFNPVASRIWKLLDTPKSLQQLSLQLQAEYEVDDKQCQEDVQKFMAELVHLGIVRSCPTA
jgi:Coenzyme PQQ synthesis protein D (PqqD)